MRAVFEYSPVRLLHEMGAFSPGLLAVYVLLAAQSVCGCNNPRNSTTSSRDAISVDDSKQQHSQAPSRSTTQPVIFTELAEQCGVKFQYHSGTDADQCTILESLGGGLACLDFDRDGRLDLYFAGGGEIQPGKLSGLPGSLWWNRSEWKFTKVTEQAGVQASLYYTHGANSADYDNDGFSDLLITGYGGLQLLHNEGDGTFTHVEGATGLVDKLWSSSAGFADLDGNGVLDIYVCHYVDWSFANHPFCRGPNPGQRDICPPRKFNALPHILFYANGDGTFRDGSAEAGLRNDGKGLGVILSDLDGDLDMDIYVANDTTDNFLYLNDGGGRFDEVGVQHGCALDQYGGPNGSMGVAVGDYDLDGAPDLWVANFEQEAFALYRNMGNSMFLHVSEATGVTALGGLFVGFGTTFLDVDFDGDEDLVGTNGHVIKFPTSGRVPERPILLLNENGKRYRRLSFDKNSFFGKEHRGRGLIASDLDNDGDLDLAISHNDEPVALLKNESARKGHYVRVRLTGRNSNRDAIGAHLELETTAGTQHRWICGGGSYLSQSAYDVNWGVPKGVTIRALKITWPSGTVQTVTNVEPDQVLALVESDDHDESR